MLNLISYNISNNSKLLKQIVSNANKSVQTIIAVQEISKENIQYITGSTINRFQIIVNNNAYARQCFLVTNDILVQVPINQVSSRYTTFVLNCNQRDVLFVNAHIRMPTSDSNSDLDNQNLFREIYNYCNSYDANVVIMGDLNYPPFKNLIACRSGLNAKRDPEDIQAFGFYNPCWKFLVRQKGMKPKGTFYYNSTEEMIKWNVVDQIIVSKELCNKLTNVDILSSFMNIDTLKFMTDPDNSGSGHLPIGALLNI
jgi:exonuclease III